jgi:hypothetical protein
VHRRSPGTSVRHAVLAVLLLAALPASAAAAPDPPTLASQFTPAGIGTGGTGTLVFTLTNPNTSGMLTGLGFSDTLPSELVVDRPNGVNGTCGAAGALTAPSGSSTISLTGGALVAGGTCSVQVSVTSSVPGTYQNSTGPVTSAEAGNGTGDTQTLTVFGLPSVSITGPREHGVYAFGQRVIAHYGCTDAAGAPGIAACAGDADSGSPIDTSSEGPNTFTVSAVSADGAITTQTIDYVVLADSRFTVTKLTGHTDGSVSFRVKLPNPGKLVSTVTRNGRTFGQTSTKVRSDGTVSVAVKPNAAGRNLIKADARSKHPKAIVLKLSVSFTPLLGVKRTLTVGTIRVTP